MRSKKTDIIKCYRINFFQENKEFFIPIYVYKENDKIKSVRHKVGENICLDIGQFFKSDLSYNFGHFDNCRLFQSQFDVTEVDIHVEYFEVYYFQSRGDIYKYEIKFIDDKFIFFYTLFTKNRISNYEVRPIYFLKAFFNNKQIEENEFLKKLENLK
jgi:hypothetical protein